MSKSNTAETGLLLLIFNNTAFGGVGDTNGLQPSASAGNLYVTGHSADPGEAGDQTTSELAYPGYTRAAIARNAGGWTVSGGQVSNTAGFNLGLNTGTGVTLSFIGVGTASSGSGKLLYSGEQLGPAIISVPDATTDTLTSNGHSLTAGQAVRVRVTNGTVPGGLSTGTQYFIVNPTTNTFQVALTPGGAAVDITSVGSGQIEVRRDFYLSVGTNVTPTFSAAQLVLNED